MIRSPRKTDRYFTTRQVVLGLVGWFLAGNLSVPAAPIRSVKKADRSPDREGLASSNRDRDFDAVLAGGPDRRTNRLLMRDPAGASVLDPDGVLRRNRVVKHLALERAQHPVRFDRRHPILGPMLAAAEDAKGTQFL